VSSDRSAVPGLFDALPSGLFAPLAAKNRKHYWRLLVMLYEQFFGPDAELPPPTGIERRELIVLLERLLQTDDPWEAETGAELDSPTNIRANLYFDYFTKTGWFREELVGLARVVAMPPAVNRFMGELIAFIEQGPLVVGAKMRSIESALQRALTGERPGEDLDEAAQQARALLSSVSAIGLRVREVMRELNAAPSTAQVLRQVFEDYIAKVYMADYAELAGADHPLARRAAVLGLASELAYGPRREAVVQWHMARSARGDRARAEERAQRSLRRVLDLDRLQDFLDRLEDDLRRMNRRMLALIDYRLRAPDHFDVRVRRAVEGVVHTDSLALGVPAGPGQLLSPDLLYQRRKARAPIPREPIRLRRLTPEQEARRRLKNQAEQARMMRPHELQAYIVRALGERPHVRASDLPVESIKDLRAVQTLASLALQARTPREKQRRALFAGLLRGYTLVPDPGPSIETEYLDMPNFRLLRSGT
jgi:hypothetical protein